MAQALYRKFRPKKLSEIVGQEHITTTLERAIASGKVSHAYLFTGPRGVGKTSIARILAHEINGLSYTDESAELDIIEIDAASNRRIDEIRDLRDKVHIAPSSSKYKVYIIDEVHMLTKEAFNALLKTLEEPPAHVIFILATTEIHKLPETIISRTQRFTFKAIEPDKAVEHMRSIAKQEGLKIDDEALQLLAEHGGGSFRDSISLLDQMRSSSDKHVGTAEVERLLGIAPRARVEALLQSTLQGSAAELIATLDDIRGSGIGGAQLAKQLSAAVRSALLDGQDHGIPRTELADLLGNLLSVPAAHDPEARLEYILLAVNLGQGDEPEPVAANPKTVAGNGPGAKIAAAAPAKPVAKVAKVAKPAPEPATEPAAGPAPKPTPEDKAPLVPTDSAHTTEPTDLIGLADLSWWPQVLAEIKSHNNTLYGVLRMCVPRLEDGRLILAVAFPFHQKRLSESANHQKIGDALAAVTGHNIEFVCVVDRAVKDTADNQSFTAATQPTAPLVASVAAAAQGTAGQNTSSGLTAVTQVFGGGEVLES